MNRPPAGRSGASAAETLAICISEKIPSCIRAPPPEPLTMISGSFCSVASSIGPGQLLADDRAHAAHDERRIGDAEGHAPARESCRRRPRPPRSGRCAPARP